MPWSSSEGKWWVAEYLRDRVDEVDPDHVIITDVGAGGGGWLAILDPALRQMNVHQTWTAVEVWEPNVDRFALRDRYNAVNVTDARLFDFASVSPGEDALRVVIFGDVLEHMREDEAVRMVTRAMEANDIGIIGIPIIYYPQGPHEGNPYEVHVDDHWTHDRVLAAFPAAKSYFVGSITGCYIIDQTVVS
jgi:hypothetical protein